MLGCAIESDAKGSPGHEKKYGVVPQVVYEVLTRARPLRPAPGPIRCTGKIMVDEPRQSGIHDRYWVLKAFGLIHGRRRGRCAGRLPAAMRLETRLLSQSRTATNGEKRLGSSSPGAGSRTGVE